MKATVFIERTGDVGLALFDKILIGVIFGFPILLLTLIAFDALRNGKLNRALTALMNNDIVMLCLLVTYLLTCFAFLWRYTQNAILSLSTVFAVTVLSAVMMKIFR